MSSGDKLPRQDILPAAQALAALLAPACEQIKLAGSLRRGVPLVADVEIVCEPKHFPEGNALHWLTDMLVAEGVIRKADIEDKNGEIGNRWGTDYRAIEYQGVKFDLFTTTGDAWGYQYLLRTGPADANKRLMQLLYNAPFKFNKGAAWFGEDRIALPDEQAVFDLLGIAYIAPDLRTPQAYERALGGTHQYPNPANIIARQRAATTPWDKRYDAGEGYTWVRQPRVDTFAGEKDGHYTHTTQIDYVRLAKTSPAAQNRAAFLAGLKLPALREAYYRDFVKWQEQYIELPGYDLALHDLVDTRYLHFSYASNSVSVETVHVDQVVPVVQFVQMGKLMSEVWDIADNGVGDIDPWHGMTTRSKDPYCLRFLGDERLFLIGGQHRYMALLLNMKQAIQVRVDHIPLTLEEASKGSAIKPPGLAYDKITFDEDYWNIADVIEGAIQILAEARETVYA